MQVIARPSLVGLFLLFLLLLLFSQTELRVKAAGRNNAELLPFVLSPSGMARKRRKPASSKRKRVWKSCRVCVGAARKSIACGGETFLWRRARWRRAEPKRRENVRLSIYEQSGRSESLSFLDEVDLTSKRERERRSWKEGRKQGIPITGWKLDTDNTIRKMLTFD